MQGVVDPESQLYECSYPGVRLLIWVCLICVILRHAGKGMVYQRHRFLVPQTSRHAWGANPDNPYPLKKRRELDIFETPVTVTPQQEISKIRL